MRWVFLLACLWSVLCAGANWEKPAEPTYFPSLPSDGMVEGVNVINGTYLEHAVDAIPKGIDPFVLERCYFRNTHRPEIYCDLDSPNLLGWYFNYECSLWYESDVYHETGDQIAATQKTGSFSHYKLNGSTYHPSNYEGYMNHTAGALSGQTHIANSHVRKINKHDYRLHLGDGTERCYSGRGAFRRECPIYGSLVAWERRPSGNYVYLRNDRFETVSADGSTLLNWVSFSNGGQHWTLGTSDNRQWVCFPGKELTRISGQATFLLGQIVQPDGSSIYYRYNDHAHKGNDFFLGKDLPEGRFLRVEYEGDKVKTLLAPLGVDQTPHVKYRFTYGHQQTNVYDALGNQSLYEYDSNSRIYRAFRFRYGGNYRYEQNAWNEKGSLLAKSLRDGAGNIFLARRFQYDGEQNVICEKFFGILTGTKSLPIELDAKGVPIENGAECYTKTYTYSRDPFNLLYSESDGIASTAYTYYPNTNLLKSKLINDGAKIRLRQFRAYDRCAALCLLIEDDGETSEMDSLSGCTLRRITTFTNNMSGPGVGQPALKEEKCYDFKLKCEVLLKATRYHYNTHNECIQEDIYDSRNVHLYSIHRTFDAMGRCTSESDPLGNYVQRTYDLNGNLIKEVGPRPDVVVENGYDYSNRLIWTRKGEKTIRYRYDLCGNRVAEIDAAGNETAYTYDALGRVMRITYPPTLDADDHAVVHTEEKHYDIGDNVIRWTDARGEDMDAHYTIRGQPFVRKVANVEERLEYDLRGNLTRKIAPDGSCTCFSYDFLDRIIRTEHRSPQGESLAATTAVYSSFALLSTTDAEGTTTLISYDAAGRECAVAHGESRVETTYDTLGFPATIKRWHGEGNADYTLTLFQRDFLGHVLEERVEDASGTLYSKKKYAYDAAGNCIEQVDYLSESQTATTFLAYDAFDRLIEKRDPRGNCFTTHYLEAVSDGLGGLGPCQIDTDPLGNVTTRHFDARGRLIKETVSSPAGTLASHKQFRYDGVGNRILMKCEQAPGQWQEVRFHYAWGGKVTAIIEADRTTALHYDVKGQLIRKETPLASHTFQYDSLGRVTAHTAGSLKIHYTYDRCGRVKTIEQNGRTTLRTYDPLGNVTYEKQESGHALSYTYDRQGRRTTMTLPDGSSVLYTYLGPYLHTLTRQTPQGKYTHTYTQRDLTGKVLEVCTAEGGKVSTRYDLTGKITSLSHSAWEQQAIYDTCGNLTQLSTRDAQGSSTCPFAYDNLHQLISENGRDYTYDGVGNPSHCTVGPTNQLLKSHSTSYTNDAEGRLASSPTFQCTYDPLDRLISYNKTTYSYDGLNRRITQDKTTFLYDGNREIGTIDAKGKLIEFRLLGESSGSERGATVVIELKGVHYTTLSDIRGNVACLIQPSGKVAECYRYTAFGETKASTLGNPWRFSSKRTDPESGWVFFGRRYYSPTLARFTTPDPLGYTDTLNLYTFVHNNPLTHSDLYGYKPENSERTLRDFFSDILRHTMHCIEWIGKNLIPLPGIRDIVESIGRWGSGGKLLSLADYHTSECGIHIIPGKKIPGATVALINGVGASLDETKADAAELSKKLGGVQVVVLYNSTSGYSIDLIECILLKLGGVSPPEKMIIDFVKSTLKESPNEIIHIHAHSQGGLHLHNASRHLKPEERGQMEVTTYGSASLFAKGSFKDVQHFVSRTDLIPLYSITNYFKAILGMQDNVTFLSPTHYNPLKEHMIGKPTYQGAMEKVGYAFQDRYL